VPIVLELGRAKVRVVTRSRNATALDIRADHRHEALSMVQSYVMDVVQVGMQDTDLRVMDQVLNPCPAQLATSHPPANAELVRVLTGADRLVGLDWLSSGFRARSYGVLNHVSEGLLLFGLPLVSHPPMITQLALSGDMRL
jgi:hypothetical protein